MRVVTRVIACAMLTMAAAYAPMSSAAATKPDLVVLIVVDQLSADLFERYRDRFTAGLATLNRGAVFASGYQGHASTFTCPGHAAIGTGLRPTRSGIVANGWYNPAAPHGARMVNCVEDEAVAGSTALAYSVSLKHLRGLTLGDRFKQASTSNRVVALAGKDRSAVLLGGGKADQVWWWDKHRFVSFDGRSVPPAVAEINRSAATRIATEQASIAIDDSCAPLLRPIPVGSGHVGDHRFARAAGDATAFTRSPEADQVLFDLARTLVSELHLGQGSGTDLLTLGVSTTDLVGHAYGAGGVEMCVELMSLDRTIGRLLHEFDERGIDYVVALSADHGAPDVPERATLQGSADARRTGASLTVAAANAELMRALKLSTPPLHGSGFGDMWLDASLVGSQRARVLSAALDYYRGHRDVAEVYARDEITKLTVPSTSPDKWSVPERVRAAFDPERSGDFYVVLEQRVMPVAHPVPGEGVLTHGSPWDYDRRVPLLFWRKGLASSQHSGAVETVDIVPTLAAMIGLPLQPGEVDGRCLMECSAPSAHRIHGAATLPR